MYEYGLLNLVYVNNNCKELEELPRKTKDVVNDLKRISKTKEIIFIRFFIICPKYYDNKWYPAQHMIKIGFSSKKVSPTIYLN